MERTVIDAATALTVLARLAVAGTSRKLAQAILIACDTMASTLDVEFKHGSSGCESNFCTATRKAFANRRRTPHELVSEILALAGLSDLRGIGIAGNNLDSLVPSLSGLSLLKRFSLFSNDLSRPLPPVLVPNVRVVGQSSLCTPTFPNYFEPVANLDRDLATGTRPWHRDYRLLPDSICADAFDP